MKPTVLAFIIATGFGSAQAHSAPEANAGFASTPLQACHSDLRFLNQLVGWQGEWPRQWLAIVARKPESIGDEIEYWSQASASLDTTIAHLQSSIKSNETAPKIIVERILPQVASLSAELESETSSYTFRQSDHPNALHWNDLLRTDIAPSIKRYESFLHDTYLKAAKTNPGLSEVKDGRACFESAVVWWTGLSLSTEEIEAIGWKSLEETKSQLRALHPNKNIETILADLRQFSDENNTSGEQLISISESALARAQQKLSSYFSNSINQKIVVEPLAKHLHDSFPAGRYMGATDTETAKYLINPSRPNERRLMAEVITFHEGLPGHHLWASYPRDGIGGEYSSGVSGLLEGWAIYSEYLAAEMNLYSSELDLKGMHAKHLWAASRLIIEPGLHLKGWSREKAIRFMRDNTALSDAEIELEVDRYIAMPAQSLTYILGSDLLRTERSRAEHLMSERFDIKEFHDIVLKKGPRPLEIVKNDIREWASNSNSDD